MQYKRFNYQSQEELLDEVEKLNKGGIPFSEHIQVLNDRIKLGTSEIKNRLLAQPIEGFDSELDGSPSERTIKRYCTLAKGGSGIIWMESISVNSEGRSNPYQLWISEMNCVKFSQMIERIKNENGIGSPVYIVGQLTHSGRYSNSTGKPTPVCAIHNPLIPKENERIITDGELEKLKEDYVSSALLCEKVGFDAVDIRACHGYLLNELFSGYSREGKYGGSFENRVKLLVDIVDSIKSVSNIEVSVRLNVYDGVPYPYGWGCDKNDVRIQDMTEPLRLVKILWEHGVRVFNISSGIGAYSPYVIRPYDRGNIVPEEHQLEGIERMLNSARKVKEHLPDVIVVASAFSWLREYAQMVAAGGIKNGWFDIAGFGRQTLAYPDYAKDILSGTGMQRKKSCITCGCCTELIKVEGKMIKCVINNNIED